LSREKKREALKNMKGRILPRLDGRDPFPKGKSQLFQLQTNLDTGGEKGYKRGEESDCGIHKSHQEGAPSTEKDENLLQSLYLNKSRERRKWNSWVGTVYVTSFM